MATAGEEVPLTSSNVTPRVINTVLDVMIVSRGPIRELEARQGQTQQTIEDLKKLIIYGGGIIMLGFVMLVVYLIIKLH